MAYNSKAVEYMRGRGAINDETDIFFFILVAHLKMAGKKFVMAYINFER